MPRGYKITPNFDTLSKTINVLGSELGNVIKDQAGAKYFKIVEDIRLNSKKYPSRKLRAKIIWISGSPPICIFPE